MSKVILISGCSSGIGRDLVQHLTEAGETVVATARNVESLAQLEAALKLSLDVTEPKSIDRAMNAVLQNFGRIDVLINNAGYAQVGAIEELTDPQVRQMYDVNVFGVLRMIRSVIPCMRKQGAGRIINISSIAGRVATPVNGAYSSTKFALEALSDALRFEVAPFNIQVILIEPGAIKTNFDQTVHAFGDGITSNPATPYRSMYTKYQQVSDRLRGLEPGPEAVSSVVMHALETAKPKARYLAGASLPTALVLHFRDYLWELAAGQMYKA